MIYFDLAAVMTCDLPKDEANPNGCDAHGDATVVLLMSGGFGLKKPPDGWQILSAKGVIGGPMMCRCPKHQVTANLVQPAKLQIGPRGPRIVLGGK